MKNNNITGNQIYKYRTLNDLTMKELGEKVGVAEGTISYWEAGKSSPRMDKINKLAKIFNISSSILIFGETQQNGKSIPLLGSVAAGEPIFAENNILGHVKNVEKGDYALTIKGDSMEPLLLNGNIVIVDTNSEINNNDIVVVLINGDEAVCKKYKKVDEGIMLISLNQKYEPKFFSKKDIKSYPVTILGRVVEYRGKL